MNKIKITYQITSSTHRQYLVDCSPMFQITQNKNDYFIEGEIKVGNEVDIDAWRAVDSFLAGISVVEEGVFSRVVWTRHNLKNSMKWLSPPPNELPGAGIKVMEDKSIDTSKKDDYIDAYLNIYEKAVKYKSAFSILSRYTVSN